MGIHVSIIRLSNIKTDNFAVGRLRQVESPCYDFIQSIWQEKQQKSHINNKIGFQNHYEYVQNAAISFTWFHDLKYNAQPLINYPEKKSASSKKSISLRYSTIKKTAAQKWNSHRD